jgi:citrate lyase subunit beta / citryl-CoA lyase
VIVIDLEDAVADSEKTAARAITRAAVPTYGDQVVTVRVNGLDTGRLEDDVEAVVCPELAAILVPKIEDLDTLRIADEALARAEPANGMERGSVKIVAIIETPAGVARCEEILSRAPDRTVTSIFGLGDFSVALGVEPTEQGLELLYGRGRVIVATRAAGMVAPVDGPYLKVEDLEGLVEDSRRSRALGFQGRVAVYPPQVEGIHAAFSDLSEEEAAAQRRVVEGFEEAEARGVASIRLDGRFIDYPIYRLARDRLRRYDAYRATGERA